MLTLTERVPPVAKVDAELALPYELREKSRLRASLSTGEEAALFLPRNTVLRGGDCLKGIDDGGQERIVRVLAAPEKVLEVECHDADEFARCAYHLGNRHTPVQIIGRKADGHFSLRIRVDHVLADMLEGLGAHSHETMAPFEPETGAYGGHSHVGGHDDGHEHEHGDDDGHHAHGHDHGHDHSHGHGSTQGAAHSHAPHPGSRMPVHQPKIHRPDPATWSSQWQGTQDK